MERRAVQRVSKGFSVLAELCGFDNVSPHTLRHTAITWQAQLGVRRTKSAASSASP